MSISRYQNRFTHSPLCAAGVTHQWGTPLERLETVAITASRLVSERAADYAKDAAPRSPNPQLSSNKVPLHTRLSWLAGRSKCNQFVGDVLYESGFRMPTLRMPDGSKHYMNAERLPSQRDHFQIVKNRDDVRPGDVLVIDYNGRNGENGAHTEIIGALGPKGGDLVTVGAHAEGAEVKDRHGILNTESNGGTFWKNASARVYVLRPMVARE
ncbi:MAG: hypothetical protein EBZ48_03285 [Proteobacteria bacterium]|nr:hypothetical protein [Pseudomonadota bacterium]